MQIYREKSYNETCVKIWQLFKSLNIKTQISTKNSEGFFFTTLRILNTNIISNGKGITSLQSSVSALAEMMERIQNNVEFTVPVNNFWLRHVEISDINLTKNNLLEESKEILEKIFLREADMIKTLDVLEKFYEDKIPCNFYFLESVNKFIPIPIALVSIIYGTNGMSAGNSLNEAIKYSEYEIYERHVNKNVCKDLYKSYVHVDPYAQKYVCKDIEIINQIPYKVIFFRPDEENAPVVGMLIIDKKEGRHFIKFGAHHDKGVAIERCLTEFFQGRELEKLNKYLKNTCDLISSDVDCIGAFRSGDISYSPATICKIVEGSPSISREKKESIFDKEILIRDVSFLGFPAVHSIIPGYSEVGVTNFEEIISVIEEATTFKYLYNFDKLEKSKKFELMELLIKHNKEWGTSLKIRYKMPMKDSMLDDKPIAWIILALIFKYGCDKDIEKVTKKYVFSELFSNKAIENAFRVFIRFYFNENKDIGVVEHQLKNIFDDKIVDSVVKLYNGIVRYEKKFPKLNCYDCVHCDYFQNCEYENTVNFFDNIVKIKGETNYAF